MEPSRKVRIAVVGLGFGQRFIPIYQNHPDVEYVGICALNSAKLHEVGDKLGITAERRHIDISEVVQSDQYDAVHIVTPIPLHAQQAVAVLNSGKHCACAVPMATTLDELHAIVDASRTNVKNYMMMETMVYGSYYLKVKEMADQGEFGRIQFLRGAHYQDMESWPGYWSGLPPMHYATHIVAPLLAVANQRAVKVHGFGSGYMREELRQTYGNPFPIETAIFQLEDGAVSAEVTRSLYHTAIGGREVFSVFGEQAGFEWQDAQQHPVLYRKTGPTPDNSVSKITREVMEQEPDYRHLVPKEIASYAEGGHHGSHPHLAHEFIRSIVERRNPGIDAVTSANWTAAGICAHESAMRGGAEVVIPAFD